MSDYEIDQRITNAERAIADYKKHPTPVNAMVLARADSELGQAKLDGVDITKIRKNIDDLLD